MRRVGLKPDCVDHSIEEDRKGKKSCRDPIYRNAHDANRKGGEADAERNRILAEAYERDPEFFAFIRSLAAYEVSLKGGNSSIVMQPDSEFFDYLRSDAGRPTGASVGPATDAAPANP